MVMDSHTGKNPRRNHPSRLSAAFVVLFLFGFGYFFSDGLLTDEDGIARVRYATEGLSTAAVNAASAAHITPDRVAPGTNQTFVEVAAKTTLPAGMSMKRVDSHHYTVTFSERVFFGLAPAEYSACLTTPYAVGQTGMVRDDACPKG